MKHRTAVPILSLCAFALFAPPPGFADYTGLEVLDRTDLTICQSNSPHLPFKLDVCEIHVVLDDPADRLISTAFSNVSTTDPAGFFQHTLGTNTAPACGQIALEPTLECDSFVTLGLDCVDLGDGSTVDPDFDSAGFNTSGEVSGGWYNSAPSNGQGAPDVNGRVMISRFSYKQSKTSDGDVCTFIKLAGFDDIVAFPLQPFDCAVPGMQAGTGGAGSGGPPLVATLFVDDNCVNTPGSGTEEDPYCKIQDAIVASANGDIVQVAPGTYVEWIDFLDRKIIVRSSGGAAVTTIDADDMDRVVTCAGDHGPETVLDGFTITGGDDPPDGFGGAGMLVRDTNPTGPTVNNCIFNGNTSSSGPGAGMYNFNASPTITNCTFSGNSATNNNNGGGMCNNTMSDPIVSNCTFIGNSSSIAGGMGNINASSPTVTNCIFSGNFATVAAGGLYNNDNSDAKITRCLFIGNSTDLFCGGMNSIGSAPTVTNCIFSGNVAVRDGGGMLNSIGSDVALTNCIFSGNVANNGAAIEDSGSSLTATNCTFAGNAALNNGGGLRVIGSSTLAADNCVFWENSDNKGANTDESAQISVDSSSDATLTFTDIMGLTLPGPFCDECGEPPVCCNDEDANGNIGDNPLFINEQPSGTWTAVAVFNSATGQTTFTEDPSSWSDDLKSKFLNPDTTQFLQSLIVSNTDTQIVVWGDFHELGDSNENYQIHDYHLQSGSPCLDAGDNPAVPDDLADLNDNGDTTEPTPVDLDLLRRFVNDPVASNPGNDSPEYQLLFVDMGAYEFNPCPWDLDNDGSVGASDLAQLLGEWGPSPPAPPCPPYPLSDFDLDCSVGPLELAHLLGNWGTCP